MFDTMGGRKIPYRKTGLDKNKCRDCVFFEPHPYDWVRAHSKSRDRTGRCRKHEATVYMRGTPLTHDCFQKMTSQEKREKYADS